MTSERIILHVDMDAFFASVEALENPKLRNIPLIVGGDGTRGVVASCSYEARFYGVRSAMSSVRAKQLCPQATFISGQYHLYERYSRKMHEVFQGVTPLIEPLSLDEAFLDVTGAQGLFGSPEQIAHLVRDRMYEHLGLQCSVGVANTKHLAKLASVKAKPKASPNGPIYESSGVKMVKPEEAIDFLHSLPVRAIWGLGPKTGEKLARVGIETVGQMASIGVETLTHLLGRATGEHLYALAWNEDFRQVETEHQTKSIGHEQTYAEDLYRWDQIHVQWMRLADAVAVRLRESNFVGRTVTIKVRYGTFETISRSRTISPATASASRLVKIADELADEINVEKGIRLLGMSVSNLESAEVGRQLTFDVTEDVEDVDVLDEVMDEIRTRFGDSAVVPAPFIGADGQGVLRRGDQQWGPGGSGRSSGGR